MRDAGLRMPPADRVGDQLLVALAPRAAEIVLRNEAPLAS